MWFYHENQSKQDVLDCTQTKHTRNSYTLGNMHACSDLGNVRSNQEDAVLLLEHPQNKKFKLLAVADGMGGHQRGEVASLYAMTALIHWFEKIPSSYYTTEKNIALELPKQLQQIHEKIRQICNGGGTTLALAVVARNNTFLVNIGDSRIYIHHHHRLTQLSVDHSVCWDLFQKGIILNKDDIRFHRQSNYVTSVLGWPQKINQIHSTFISNRNYDKLLLFTDGVTNCLSEQQINTTIETTSSKTLASQLVDKALNTDSLNQSLATTSYVSLIPGGIDNASCVVLTKKI